MTYPFSQRDVWSFTIALVKDQEELPNGSSFIHLLLSHSTLLSSCELIGIVPLALRDRDGGRVFNFQLPNNIT